MVKALRVTLAAILLLVLGTSASSAAVTVGATTVASAIGTRGSAVGYDSVNHVYLVVSTFGVLRGRFADRSGQPLGAPFVIQGDVNLFSHFPSVAFAPDADNGAGGFLVVWH